MKDKSIDNNTDPATQLIEDIKNKLGQVNSLHSFIAYVLFALVFSFTYEQAAGLFEFIPDVSISIIILIVLVMTLMGSFQTRKITQQIISSIDSYDRSLKGIINTTKEISEETESSIIFEKILDSALLLTESDAASMLLIEGEEMVIKLVKGENLSDLSGMSVPKDQGAAGWAAEHETPIYFDDVTSTPEYSPSLDWLTEYKTKSILCVPLIIKGSVIGVIELLNKKNGVFNENDVDILTFLASNVSYAIERSSFTDSYFDFENSTLDILVHTIDNLTQDNPRHSLNVARYTDIIAREISMSEDELARLKTASLLHDIGYLSITFGFDRSVSDATKKHVKAGYEMLLSIKLYSDIAPFVLHHHEKFDGSGYPDALEGSDIPLESRIIAIAETFEKILNSPEIRKTQDIKLALKRLKDKAGSELDPHLTDILIANAPDDLF